MALSSSSLLFLRRFAIALVACIVLSATGVVAGNALARKKFDERKTTVIPGLTAAKAGEPANFLLIGSDTREGADSQFGSASDTPGQRSDVMMILHVEPKTRTGMLVSFPRDLLVQIPGHGKDKLNATYSLGGPKLVIDTMQGMFPGLKINHYLEVDFNGFRDIVDAVGHIKLYFPTPAHDPYSGLNQDKSGCVSVDGKDALAYARSRHYYIPKNPKNPVPWQWNYDPKLGENAYRGGSGWTATGSDLDRIPRQQYFLRTLAKSAVDKTAADPTKLLALLDAIKNNFTSDTGLKYSELQALVRTFNKLDPNYVDMETLPVTEVGNTGSLELNDQSAALISQLVNPHKTPPTPAPVPPANITVKIANGATDPHLAQKVFDDYKAAGFHMLNGIDDADRPDYKQTQIRFAPGMYPEGYWTGVAAGTINIVEAASRENTVNADALIVVGNDYDSLQHAFPGQAPTTSPTAGNAPASSTTASTSTTTTTVVPPETYNPLLVPVDPKNGAQLTGCPSS